ncbi:MAG: HAD family phosphatase [Anaerolineales bacterium]|nr:HAD family phosphatase [Anaerolineales bacterium]
MIKAVVFDFGGVLLRTADQSGRERWEARLGLPPRGLSKLVFDSEAARRATAGAAGTDEVWGHVAATLHLEPDALAELQRDFWSGDKVDTQLVALIRSLRPRYQTAILSNAWPDGRALFTKLFGASDTFDLFIISSEEHLAKPEARLYHLAAERLGVQSSEVVFVDDFAHNVEGARAAGMQAIHYTPGLDVKASLKAAGVEV